NSVDAHSFQRRCCVARLTRRNRQNCDWQKTWLGCCAELQLHHARSRRRPDPRRRRTRSWNWFMPARRARHERTGLRFPNYSDPLLPEHDAKIPLTEVIIPGASASSDNTMLIPWEIWRDRFMRDAPESVARSVWERLSPEPNQVNVERLDLKHFYSLTTPRSFTHRAEDWQGRNRMST